jgi:hypothetical protein
MRKVLVERSLTFPDPICSPAGLHRGAESLLTARPGWRDLLDLACSRIGAAVHAHGGAVKISQIQVSRGCLNLYWQGTASQKTRDLVEDALALAEARSACTCEICGNDGKLHRHDCDLLTRCDIHARGNLVKIPRGFANVHLVRITEGSSRSIQICRYDRIGDSFVVLDAASLGSAE